MRGWEGRKGWVMSRGRGRAVNSISGCTYAEDGETHTAVLRAGMFCRKLGEHDSFLECGDHDRLVECERSWRRGWNRSELSLSV